MADVMNIPTVATTPQHVAMKDLMLDENGCASFH
jgi:hypothetical protein